jgi:hypothetical protein
LSQLGWQQSDTGTHHADGRQKCQLSQAHFRSMRHTSPFLREEGCKPLLVIIPLLRVEEKKNRHCRAKAIQMKDYNLLKK